MSPIFRHETAFAALARAPETAGAGAAGSARQGVAMPEGIPCRVLSFACHQGKGAAARAGVLVRVGEFVLFADSGLCVPFRDARLGLELIRAGECAVAPGSRRLPANRVKRSQSLHRRAISAAFRPAAARTVDIPSHLTDTQCGSKVYRGDVARELYGPCAPDGFLFDIEIILRATRAGHRIAEFPIEWTSDADTRLRPARHAVETARDLLQIRRTLDR